MFDLIKKLDVEFETNQTFFDEYTPTGGLFNEEDDFVDDELLFQAGDELALDLDYQAEKHKIEIAQACAEVFG